MSKYILSIDQGTTSTRSIVFNNKFEIVSIDQIELKQYFPKDGCVEHDPKEIYETVLKTSKNAIKKSNIKPTDISAIGITCLLYTSPSPRDRTRSRMPSSA